MSDFLNAVDWSLVFKSFLVGGTICLIGQILIDKTKLSPARILVLYVATGAILGGLRYLSILNCFCRCWGYGTTNWFWMCTCKRHHTSNW